MSTPIRDDDHTLVQTFEAGSEPDGGFHHREHVRVAWYYLQLHPLAEALARFSARLRAFAAARGKPNLYHETITVAYVLFINERLDGAAKDLPWEEFAAAHPELLAWKPSLLDCYYSEETLKSERSRRTYVWPEKVDSRESTVDSHENRAMRSSRRSRASIVLVLLAAAAAASIGGVKAQEATARPLPPSAERAYRALAVRIDALAAMETVRYMDQYWRLAANPGFNASIDYIRARLLAAGFAESPDNNRPFVRVDEWGQARGWDYQLGTLSFADNGEVLLSRLRDRVSLCINSFPTAKGGIVARLVDVGDGGAPASYASVDVKGAVVLGDAEVGPLWRHAVKERGAIGVISTRVASYIRPADPKAFTAPDQQDVLQWGTIPYDSDVKGFGFKASYRAAARMRERLENGPVDVRIEIESSFYDGPNRTLVAEIPGAVKPDERIVLAAHLQEPGANDNGSGAGTLQAIAAALVDSARGRGLDRPARTLTFLWLDEMRGSRQWIAANPEQAKNTQYMFSLDMTGEDTAKTGGTFLIEKQADPSAVWKRPSDPHSDWGAGEVKAESLRGSLLNDVHHAICLRRAKDSKWTVRTNPYEGGSDHTVFADAGVPSLLNWHFTDRYYHTNLDRPDKTSPLEMLNVGIAVATSAWFLASADERDALAVVDLVSARADARLALEQTQGAEIAKAATDKAAADATEQAVLAAWRKWYVEALDSVRRLPARGSTPALDARIQQAQERLQQAR